MKQALAATDLFFGDDLAKLDTPALASALAGDATVPSMVVPLRREQAIGQPLERFLIASTIVESKSEWGSRPSSLGRVFGADEWFGGGAAQARKAIEAGMITLNGVKIKAKSHQRVIGEGDVLEGGLMVVRLGKSGNKAIRIE